MSQIYVITTVRGRHRHLRRQRCGLALSHTAPAAHIVVTMGDDDAARLAAELPGPPVHRLPVPMNGRSTLPLAAARNRGVEASAALHRAEPDDLLIFLDVDCIPSPELVDYYARAAAQRPDDLLCGPVAYLPENDPGWVQAQRLRELAEPHPARPAPAPYVLQQGQEYELFWSLSFALRRGLWEQIGGFDESFTGYGAEDTDFAQRARLRGVGLCWVGGAEAFHQHHPVSDPPVEHLEDILVNGRRFADSWGWWPMQGWLEAFEELGLVHRTTDGFQSTLRVASVPQSHVYIRHLGPPEPGESCVLRLPDPPARRADTPQGAPWWPPMMLDPEWVRSTEFDVFHLHFGFDAEPPQRLAEICDALQDRGAPLVYTVHDLQNPHHTDTALHTGQLDVLMSRATRVITLSHRAAEIIAGRWGVQAQVIPHPHVVDLPLIEGYQQTPLRRQGEFRLGVHLKSLRQNMAAIPVLNVASAAVAQIPGGVLQVNVHHDVYDQHGARHDSELRAWLQKHPQVDLQVHDYFNDAELYDYLSSLHASLLPYRFGTHSGWLEACHDLGTRVIAADVGCYASQGADHLYQWAENARLSRVAPRGGAGAPEAIEERERSDDDAHSQLVAGSLEQAVQAAAQAGESTAPDGISRAEWRAQQRHQIAAAHERIYREALKDSAPRSAGTR
ncbi:glycosyltransferase [Nesterenkonia ebinurensis]|uniref:glycosyltransferase n=1 Tax=Nesterenkonia ebinurensis TaxID=2608252 RepID=UPI001CC5260E|nr:galactosyltransferase-related protein [Nesterenkonia ebinurensis]